MVADTLNNRGPVPVDQHNTIVFTDSFVYTADTLATVTMQTDLQVEMKVYPSHIQIFQILLLRLLMKYSHLH